MKDERIKEFLNLIRKANKLHKELITLFLELNKTGYELVRQKIEYKIITTSGEEYTISDPQINASDTLFSVNLEDNPLIDLTARDFSELKNIELGGIENDDHYISFELDKIKEITPLGLS